MNLKYYETLYTESMLKVQMQKKRFNQCSLLRGCAALCACGFIIAGYVTGVYAAYLLGAVAAAAFLLLVRWHNRIEKDRDYHMALQETAEEYLARADHRWKCFEIDGAQYLTADFRQAKDLDLFGKHSLYQYLCAASTSYGQERLASWIKNQKVDLSVLGKRQKAVAELAEKVEFSSRYQSLARPERQVPVSLSKEIVTEFLRSIQGSRPYAAIFCILIWGSPILTLFFLFSAILGVNRSINTSLFLIMAGVQLLAALVGSLWNSRLLKPVYKLNQSLSRYRKMVAAVQMEEFTSKYIKELQKRLLQKGNAGQALEELEHISDSVTVRHNVYALIICNSLFLYDFHCVSRFLSWAFRYHGAIESWLEVIGEVEALISLGVLCQIKTEYCFPELKDSKQPFLMAKNIRHPLITEQISIGNDFTLKQHTCVITGSNMSGKTTFMRTIGMNLVLAYAGGPVAATQLCVPPMQLCTSMRIEDSVSEGISTFYAELLCIKDMIEHSRLPMPMLALIDEIYKGTNSKDRIIGARETIKSLRRPNVITILTTHDFELCDLEKEDSADIVNYHFTEHYTENEILFDYKIRKGRCQTTNAQYLLRMAGILQGETSQ